MARSIDGNSLTGSVRRIIEDLTDPGQTVSLAHIQKHYSMEKVRTAAYQSRLVSGCDVEVATVNGVIWMRNLELPPVTSMPGMDPTPTEIINVLLTMLPWSDDPHAERKKQAIEIAIDRLTETT
jgi:hypothetical protein